MTNTPTPTSVSALSHSHAVARSVSRGRRRCITLLEVLVVLALLAGLAALVLPSLFDRLDERAFEAAADSASEQLMMARAHAQATGEAIEVTYSPTTGQVRARVYAPWSSEIDVDAATIEPGTSPLRDPSARQSLARERLHDNAIDGDGDESTAATVDTHRAISEPWATRELGSGMCFARQPAGFPYAAENGDFATDDSPGMTGDAATDDIETLEDLERGQEVRLAVFMPDGSALVGDGVFLNDQRGRCGRLSVNPWSGLPMFVRLADLAARSVMSDDSAENGGDVVDDDDASTFERSSRGGSAITGEEFNAESDPDAGNDAAARGDWDDEPGDETDD